MPQTVEERNAYNARYGLSSGDVGYYVPDWYSTAESPFIRADGSSYIPSGSSAAYASGGSSAAHTSGGSYDSLLGSLQSQLEAARQAQEQAAAQRKAAYESALRSQYDTSMGALSQQAAGANTGEYIRYMQNQAKLPQQAALLGTGGLSESSLMGLNASYGGNLNAIELERARSQASLEGQLAQGIAAGEGNYADTMAGIGSDYANMLLSLSLQEQANQAAREQSLQAQSNWEREFAANQAQLGITNALNAQKYADSQAKSISGNVTSGTDKNVNFGPDENVNSGGESTNKEWENVYISVRAGDPSRRELALNKDYYVSKFGESGYNALYTVAR